MVLSGQFLARLSLLAAGLTAIFLAAISGCSDRAIFQPPLLYGVSVEPMVLRPDGANAGGEAKIRYSLGRRAYVTLAIVEPNGTAHVLRDSVLRAADQYETRFDGAVATGEGPNLRVLGDGEYTVSIKAVGTDGAQAEQRAKIAMRDADSTSLEVTNLVVRPTTITPNNGTENDQAYVSYSLSKKAKVTVFATDSNGHFALILAPTEQQGEAGLPVPWDGRENGGRLLPNGTYTIHVQAVDGVGNLTEAAKAMTIENGGTPMMAISKVKLSPPVVPKGGILRIEITVKNVGDIKVKSLGPDPGTRYRLSNSYASFVDERGTPIYYERPGRWRVGVMWNNAPQPYPVRWGFGPTPSPDQPFALDPGQEVTVTGEIVIDTELPRTGTYFWAGIEQGGVGFLDTNKGQTEIRFAY